MTSPLMPIAICVFVIAGLICVAFVIRDFRQVHRQRRASGTAVAAQSLTAAHAPPVSELSTDVRLPYVRTPQLLTPAEQTFFTVLQSVVPAGFTLYPQMRLASIVQVEKGARNNYTHFNRVQAKCVDFVLCEAQTTAPRLVVELDDSSHSRRDRKERDAFVDQVLASAGVPILHVRWQRTYDVHALARNVQTLLNETPSRDTALPATSLASFPAKQVSPSNAQMHACPVCQGQVSSKARHCPHCGVTRV